MEPAQLDFDNYFDLDNDMRKSVDESEEAHEAPIELEPDSEEPNQMALKSAVDRRAAWGRRLSEDSLRLQQLLEEFKPKPTSILSEEEILAIISKPDTNEWYGLLQYFCVFDVNSNVSQI